MSSNATGDTQPEQAVIADQPAAAYVAGPRVPADESAGSADGGDDGRGDGSVDGTPGEEPPAEAGVAAGAADTKGEPGGAAAEAGADGGGPARGGTDLAGPDDAGEDDAYEDGPDEDGPDEDGPDEDGPDGEADDPAEGTEFPDPVARDEAVEEFRPARRWPRILLAVGFLMAAAAIVIGAFAIVGSLTHGFKKPVKVTYKKSAVFSLKTGDCLDPQGQQSYTLISCNSPHVAEVFATFKLPGTKWPGSTAAATAASSGCSARLSGYLNPQLAISLASTYVYPDSVAWQAGTRTVICEVRASSGQLTGSVRGASATAG